MIERYRVTFFDLEHRMRRTLDVAACSPMDAAETGLKRLLDRDMFVTDFGPSVQVEIITSVMQSLPLSTVAQRLQSGSQIERRVA